MVDGGRVGTVPLQKLPVIVWSLFRRPAREVGGADCRAGIHGGEGEGEEIAGSSRQILTYFQHCFGSGSGWIRIQIARLDPDPYSESGSGS